MAITRAQQFRQMLKEGSKDPVIQGGVENYLGKQPQVVVPRNWQSGPDKPPTELAYITEAEKKLLLKEDIHGSLKEGPNKGPGGVMSLDSFGDIGGAGAGGADTKAGGGAKEGAGFSGRSVSEMRGGREADQEFDRRIANEKAKLQMAERKRAKELGIDERENIADYGSADELQRLYMRGVPKSNLPGFFGAGLNALSSIRNIGLRKNIDYFRDLQSRGRLKNYPQTVEGYKQYMEDRLSGEITATGNPGPATFGGPDDQILFPVDDGQGGSALPDDPDDSGEDQDTQTGGGLSIRFRKDGGRINAMDGGMMSPEGGIMDLETGRQMYFLGKLVKKATRAVKKITKSPLGKAALGIAALKFGPAFLKSEGLKKFFLTDPSKGFSLGNLFGKGLTTKGAMAGIAALSAAPLLFGQEEDDDEQEIDRGPSLDIARIRNNPYDFLGRAFVADGGMMRLGYQEGSKEPVAKKTMPLLDMGGKEMDLRDNGGFVPIGRMEKADDVPARLSKNEFVFTADAVRNAGEGDVDKGAEVMYNMMKNLEAGGEVSEESQGLEGAREMFQTSKRLEEVL
jgi:hypothetical protein